MKRGLGIARNLMQHWNIGWLVFDGRTCAEVEESRDMINNKLRRRQRPKFKRCKDGAYRATSEAGA